MSIRQRLNLTHGLMAVLVFVLILGANVVVNTLHRDFASLTEQTLEVTRELQNLRAAGQRIVSSTAEYVLLSKYEMVGESAAREEIALIDQGTKLYDSAFGRYSQYVDQFFPDEASFRDDIGDAGVALIAGSRVLVDLARKDAALALLAEQKETFEGLERSYLATVTTALVHERKEYEERKEEILEGITTAGTLAWAGFAVMVVAIILSGYLLARSITECKEAEEKVRRNEEFLQTLLDTSPAPIHITSMDEGRFLVANRAAADLHRLTQEELLEHHTSKEIYFDPSERKAIMQRTVKAGRLDDVDLHARRVGTGEECWLFFNSRVIDYKGQKAVLAVTQDITERKESELENERLRRGLEATGIGTFAADIVAGTTEWDDCSLAIYGLTREQFLGDKEAWENALHPDDREATLKCLDELIAEGAMLYDVEYRIVRPSGEVRHVHAEGSFERDDKGELLYHHGTHRDITERKQAEAELRRREEFLQTLLDTSPVPIYVSTLSSGEFLMVNEAVGELHKMSPPDLLKHTTKEMYLDLEIRSQLTAQLDETGTVENFDIQARRIGTGELCWLSLSAAPIEYQGEDAAITVAQDITERKEAEDTLREARDVAEDATRAKDMFLAAMSHELRTPLNSVAGLAELLEETELKVEQTEMVDAISGSTRALLHIVDDILDFSEIEAGKLDLDLREDSIGSTVESVGETLAGSARKKNLRLNTKIDPKVPATLLLDSLRIRQILFNLAGNAIKFTHSKAGKRGIVEIGIMLDKPIENGQATVRYYVKDNGIGISKSDQKDLFEPFQQLDAATTRRYDGTGLGLTICSSLTELMGGKMSVDSAKGKGSTFSVTLTHPVAPTANGKIREQNLDGLSGLVITRSKATAAIIKDYLSDGGCKAQLVHDRRAVTTALGGKKKSKRPFDFIVLDQSVSDEAALELLPEDDRDEILAKTVPLFITDLLPTGVIAPDGIAIRGNPVRRADLLRAAAEATGRVSPRISKVRRGRGNAPAAKPLQSREAALAAGQLVLVADDNAANRDVINRQLTRLGYTADILNDGVEALKAIERTEYALLLTDCHMPKMDGYDLAENVRKSEAGSDKRLPIVAITADATKTALERCRTAGMDDYLVKPVELQRMAETMSKWLPDHPASAAGDDATASGTPVSAPMEPKAAPSPPDVAPIDLQHMERVLGFQDPDDIKATLAAFWDSAKDSGSDLSTALAQKNAMALKSVAHSNKGASRYVGALALGDALEALEAASKVQDWAKCETLLEQVKNELQRVESYIQSI